MLFTFISQLGVQQYEGAKTTPQKPKKRGLVTKKDFCQKPVKSKNG
jgi:hypothetical protein